MPNTEIGPVRTLKSSITFFLKRIRNNWWSLSNNQVVTIDIWTLINYIWFVDPVKSNPSSVRPPASKVNFDSLLKDAAGISDFGSMARQGTAAIGDIRKAELAKELDPNVFKVCFINMNL